MRYFTTNICYALYFQEDFLASLWNQVNICGVLSDTEIKLAGGFCSKLCIYFEFDAICDLPSYNSRDIHLVTTQYKL